MASLRVYCRRDMACHDSKTRGDSQACNGRRRSRGRWHEGRQSLHSQCPYSAGEGSRVIEVAITPAPVPMRRRRPVSATRTVCNVSALRGATLVAGASDCRSSAALPARVASTVTRAANAPTAAPKIVAPAASTGGTSRGIALVGHAGKHRGGITKVVAEAISGKTHKGAALGGQNGLVGHACIGISGDSSEVQANGLTMFKIVTFPTACSRLTFVVANVVGAGKKEKAIPRLIGRKGGGKRGRTRRVLTRRNVSSGMARTTNVFRLAIAKSRMAVGNGSRARTEETLARKGLNGGSGGTVRGGGEAGARRPKARKGSVCLRETGSSPRGLIGGANATRGKI